MSGQLNRFLIFNNGMIGNTLFNMPAAAWLKSTYPGCFVGMVVDRIGLELVRHDPHVDTFHIFNKKKDSLGDQFRLVMALRREKYDVSLHLRKGVRNELLARFAGVKKRAGYDIKGSPQHLHVRIQENVDVHRLKSRALLMEETFGRPVELDTPALHPDAQAEKELNALLIEHGVLRGEYGVLHPTGHSQGGIDWSLQRYGDALRVLIKDMPVFVICMPNEQDAVEKVIPSGDRVHYYTGNVAATSALIRSCNAFIGNDSGPAHMACAWNVPRVVVYHDHPDNFIKWQPVDMSNCEVIMQPEFTGDGVVEAIVRLKKERA